MDLQKHKEIFFPIALAAKDRVKQAGHRFAYYTTADVAYQVIKNKRMWMRSTTTMNDYLEIQYGRTLLLEAIRGPVGEKLKSVIDACHPNLFQEVWQQVVAWLPGFNFGTFITCVSEHDAAEDDLGRLSMWRAYGGKTGVALVFNGEVFDMQTDALGAYSSPVSYFNQREFTESLESLTSNIEDNSGYVAGLDAEIVKRTLFTIFRFAVLCTKHPGFAEEREWRIVASPALQGGGLLESEIAIVRNVPQPILKIPLEDYPEHGISGLAIPTLINRVIIGPCEFPHVTTSAIWTALQHAGIEDPSKLIYESNIPLRHT